MEMNIIGNEVGFALMFSAIVTVGERVRRRRARESRSDGEVR
jgi:hypothetical protein